jgi:hypothetical protein
MARVLHAYLHLLGTEPDGFAVARADLETAETLPSTARERAHLSVVKHLLDSEWHVASRILEDIAIEHPRDILALQVGHLVDFYTGSTRLLRDRIARALPGLVRRDARLSRHHRDARLRTGGDRALCACGGRGAACGRAGAP